MEYAVVRFTEDKSVSEVPVCWLHITDGNIQCWWPGASINLNRLIEQRVTPDSRTWELSDIVVEKYCGNLSTARVATTIIADYPCTKAKVEYAVVRFPDDSVSEVPVCWLHIVAGKSQSWWPSVKNVSSLITKKTQPDKATWSLCDVEVEKYCENLKKARNAANDIDHLTTDDEKLGKGRRKIVPAKRFSDSSSSEDELNSVPLTLKKKFVPRAKIESQRSSKPENAPTKTSTIKDANKTAQQPSLISTPPGFNVDIETLPMMVVSNDMLETTEQVTPSPDGKQDAKWDEWININHFDTNFNVISTAINPEENTALNDLLCGVDTDKISARSEKRSSERDVTAKSTEEIFLPKEADQGKACKQQCCSAICAEQGQIIIRMLASLQVNVQALHEKLKRQELRRNDNETVADTRLVKQLLPLKDIEGINDFEKLLATSEEVKSQFKAFILRINGKTPKEMIDRVFVRVFSTFVASTVTWKGVGHHFGIYDLSIVEIIKDSVCDHFCDYSEASFEDTAKEWVRLGKQRREREEKASAKKSHEKKIGQP